MLEAVRVGAWSGKSLPYDAEVEWIESTGSQWLDCGVNPKNSTVLDCTVELMSNVASQMLGAYNSWQNNSFVLWYQTNPKIQAQFGGNNTDAHYSLFNIKRRIRLSKDFYYIDDTKIRGKLSVTIDQPKSIHIFAVNNGSDTHSSTARMRLYDFKIYEGNTVVCDAKMCRFTNENGVSEGAMFDSVSGKLFRNAGTGAFVIGPDK